MTNPLKNWVLAHFLKLKKNRKPTLKDILKRAINHMRFEEESHKQKKQRASDEENSDDETEGESPSKKEDEMPQDLFMQIAADDIYVDSKYHARTVKSVVELSERFMAHNKAS